MKKNEIIKGQLDLVRNIIEQDLEISNILDIGAGNGIASNEFVKAGMAVTATGFDFNSYISRKNNFDGVRIFTDVDVCNMKCFEDSSFDAVWCAHVLEHVLDTGVALGEIWRVLRPDGYLFLSLPEYKNELVGGHINTGWNLGMLMYVLALTNFDATHGCYTKHGYNLFANVQKKSGSINVKLRHDKGDLERLSSLKLIPESLNIKQGFNGDIISHNWTWYVNPEHPLMEIEEAHWMLCE